MKNTLYHSLLNRLKNKHSKLASRFHKSVKDGEFQKQRYRKRKESVERLKSLEKRIAGLGKESGLKISLNHKHWALALAMGVVVSAKAQVSFDPPVSLGHPSLTQAHTGDLDGDGDMDGIFMSYASNPLILFNQGGLSFTQGSIPVNSVGFIESDSYLGDFDGDGDLDLILKEGPYGSTTFSAWLNDGLGNFTSSAVTIPSIQFDSGKVFVGDVDGDGDDDLVVEEEQTVSPYNRYVNVLVNTGLTFTSNQQNGPYFNPAQLKILMDADGDTDLDIVFSSYNSGAYPLMVFTNDGSGNFSWAGGSSPIYNVTNDFAAFDIDNDSDLDLIHAASTYPTASATIFLNSGSGTFSTGNTISIPNNHDVDDLLPIDINNDNFDDIIINTQVDSTFVYQSDGIGGFTQVEGFMGGSIPGDLDGDMDGDLFYFDGNVSVMENIICCFVQGPDIFSVSVSYDTDLVDIDGDGDLDIVTGSQLLSRIWLNDGAANFTVGQEIGTQGFSQEFGDLDGDSDPDMIRLIEEGNNGGLDIWTNAGGTLSYNQNIGSGSFEFKRIALANIDGDSDLDIIALVDAGFAKYLTVFRNDGGLVFTQNNAGSFYTALSDLVVGDFDGDTDIDVIMGYGNANGGFLPFTNDGAGNLTQGSTILPPMTTAVIADLSLANLDGDSDLDLLFVNSDGTTHYKFDNNGSGTFTDSGQNITLSGSTEKATVGDIDGDGDNDIIFGGYLTNPQIWLNDGTGVFTYDSDISALADEYTISALGDLDGDTDIDVVTGGYYVGTNVFLNQQIVPVPEINVQGAGLDVLAGDTTPDAADGTDFGNGTIGIGVVTTFTIQNTGTADLNVTSIGVSGTNSADFSISNITTPATIAAGGDITFDVTFNATGSGARVATIDINNDDADESMYSFDVAGNGQTEQEINLRGNGVDIVSGDTTPDAADDTDFGNVTVGVTSVRTFTIQNLGEADLDISSIGFLGGDTGEFTITNITTPITVAGAANVTFDVEYTPTTEAAHLVTFGILSNDADESPYSFDVAGNGQNPPDINIQGNAINIVTGDTTPDAADGTDLGNATIGLGVATTFVIQNTGTADLNISSMTISGANASDFTLGGSFAAPGTVASGIDTSFDVNFNPSASGVRNATITIVSDDADETNYTFDVTGIGQTEQEIDVQGGGISIVSGDTTPDVADGSDFGNVTIGQSGVFTFTILNTGEVDLNVSSIGITGADAADFAISNITTPATIAGGGSTTFDVTLSPTVSGIRNATITIDNDDSDEGTYTFDVTGVGLTEQEINVQGLGVDIVSGDATPEGVDGTVLGLMVLGDAPLTSAFTIQNTGETDLNISAITISGADAVDFAVNNITTPLTIAGGSSAIFDIDLNPLSSGNKVATVQIDSDDADEPAYTFDVAGIVQPPQEINVQGNGLDILSGDITPSVVDGTDFGTVNVGQSGVFTFTIQNTGNADLNVSAINLSGADAADFAISNITTPAVVSGLSSVTFDVTFNPTASGVSVATLNITNDDSDESVYSFDITGTGQVEQEINVQGGGLDIVSGDVTPNASDGTDFGSILIGQSSVSTFTIQNTGEADLNISLVNVGGVDALDFVVSNITTPATVGGGTDISFDVTYNASRAGSSIASVQITNDDADEPLYIFDITGFGLGEQEINIQGNGFDIASGDTTPNSADGTDFGIVGIGQPAVFTFTIQNTGDADLIVSTIVFSGVNATDFTIGSIALPLTIGAGTDTGFDIQFNPLAAGTRTATVTINNNDADESAYTFDLTGEGQAAQEINVQGGGVDIVSGDTTPDGADGTDFGTVIIGTSTTNTFTIQNTGEADLNITSVGALSGDITQFSISNITTPVAVPGSTDVTFDLTYTPTAEATHLMTVGILSDDADESLYSFDVTGIGMIDQLVVDSLAVVAFYNNNDGVNWTDNTNWLVADQNIEDWFGVDLNTAGDRVEVISLPNNNIQGTLSDDLNTLDALVTLDLSDNDIDQLATDFSGLTSASSINLDGNRLDFGDLEAVAGVGALTYDNQQSINAINETGPIEIPVGSNQTLTSTTNGTANTYQWTLNGTDVTGETATSININAIDRSNMGTYELKVSNSIATGVTLTSNPIDVLATAIITSDAIDFDTQMSIGENVNAYLFEVSGTGTPDTLDVATQTNVASPFTFPPVVLGDYLIAIESVVPLTNADGTDNTNAQYVPTYYGDTFESQFADTLRLNDDTQIQIVMVEVPPVRDETTGSGQVSGTIEDDFEEDGARIDARRRAARRKCGLKKRRSGGRNEQDDSEFELIAYGETNDQGEFEYGFLPEGTYRFFVEYPGIPLDESSFVQFEIGEAGVSDDSFVLAVFASPEGIQIELVLGVTSQFFTDFSIYPNPATDLLTIEYDKILGDKLEMQVVDLNGKTLMTRSIPKHQNKVQVDTSILSSGQYLIKFVDEKNKDNSLIYRLIKK